MSADAADEVDELAAYFELAVGNAPLDGSTMTPAAMVRGVLGSWNASGKYRLQRAGFKIIKGVVDRVLADFKLAVSQLQLAQRNHENLQALRNLGLVPVPPKQQELENGQRAWAVIKPPTDPGIIHHLVQHAKATRTSTPLVIPPYDALTLQMKMDALTAKCDAILAQAELFVKNDENAIVPVLPQEGRALLEAPPTNYQQPQQAYVQQQQYNGVQQGIYQQPQPAVQQQVYPQVYPPQYGGSSSQAGPSGVQQASVQVVDPVAQQWYEANQQHNVQSTASSSSSHPNGTGFVQQNAATAAPSYAPVFNNVTSTPTQASVSNGQAAQAAQMERLAQQQRQQQAMQEQLRLQQQQQREAQERKERERRQQEHERLMEQQRVQHEHQRLQEQQRQQQLEQQRLEQERQREQEKQRQERERLEQQRQQQQLLEKQRQEQQLRERLLEEQRRQQQAQAQSQAGPYAQSVSQSQASTSTTTASAQGATAVPQATFKESSYSSLSGALGPTTSSSTSQQPSSAAKKSTGGASSAASAAHERQALLYQQAYADRYRQYSSQLAKQGETHSNPTYPFLPPPLTGVLPAGAPGQPRPGSSAMGQNGLAAGQKVPPFMGVVPLPHPGPNGQALPHHRYFVHYSFATPPAAPPAPRAAPPARQQQPGPAVTPQSARRSTLARDIINALEGASALASVQPAPAKRKRKRSQAKAATTRRPSSPGGTTSEHADIELVTPAVAQSRLPKASRGPAAMDVDVDVDADGGATIEEADADAGAVRKKQALFWSDSSPDPDVQMQGTRSEDDVDNLLASASSPDGQNNAGASRARTPRLFPPSALPKPRAPPPAKPAISDLFREVRNGWALPKPDRLIVELPRLPKDWRPRILEADYGRFSDFSSRLSTRRCHWSDCPAVLDSEDHLQLHWDKVHGAAKSYDRDFSCLWNVCDLRPTSLEKLRHHVRCRHIRDGLRCAYEGCDFRGSGEADLAAHIAAEHGAGTLRRLAVPQQVVPVQIIPDLPQGVRPAWSLTTPPVRPAAISRERRDLLGNWVLMRIYATVDYGLITAKSPSHQRGKRKEPAPPPQMEPLVEGFELRAKEQFEWLRPASPDLPRRIPRELRVGQRPELPL